MGEPFTAFALRIFEVCVDCGDASQRVNFEESGRLEDSVTSDIDCGDDTKPVVGKERWGRGGAFTFFDSEFSSSNVWIQVLLLLKDATQVVSDIVMPLLVGHV